MLNGFGWFMFGAIFGYGLTCLIAAGGGDDDE